jgi:hypothetical protein
MNRKIKSRWLPLVCICLFLSINVSAQTDWFFVALTSSGNTIFIDKKFTRASNGIIRVWQKNVSPDDSYIIALGEWNCAKKSFRLVQSIMYDINGVASDRSDKPSQWRIVIPDSTGMLLYLNICEDNQNVSSDKQKVEKPDSEFAQIIVKGAVLRSRSNANSEVIRRLVLGEKLVLTGKKSGIWYEAYDSKTAKGYLNGNDFKIVKAKSPSKKANRARKNNGI